MQILLKKRSFLQAMAASLFLPGFHLRAIADSWPADSFKADELQAAMGSIVGDAVPAESDQINIKAPAIAENGAVVPVTVTTSLAGVKSISVFVSNNPSPLISTFRFGGNIAPYVSTRLKMAKTSAVIALVHTDGGFFTASKDVKVTIGGCGG